MWEFSQSISRLSWEHYYVNDACFLRSTSLSNGGDSQEQMLH